jgi:hypothetical protein
MERFTDTLPRDMPDAAALIEELRAAGSPDERAAIIARYPVLEQLAPVPVLAEWLGVKEQSVYMARTRTRGNGTPVWPPEDATILGRKMWTFAGVALHRASAPGRGWNLRGEVREGAK